MMKTPICDFVRGYAKSDALRLHMPGHKGSGALGFEQLDITEIDGADSLYEADGIIRQSEENASGLFGSETFYSTEGCSQCIRAMLQLTLLWAKGQGKRPLIAAARNVHKSFVSAAALLDLDVLWLQPENQGSYLSCKLDARELDGVLAKEKPVAVYLTSPDYLGNVADINAISQVCHRHGALLLVDNAHGAYLRFLQPSMHPVDLGADVCCDSAHKTLPVLTGGAYLHISDAAPALFREQAKNALMLFGSTSPSYLILQSLDAANAYLAEGYSQRLAAFIKKLRQLKDKLTAHGYILHGDEPLKLTVAAKAYGYTGRQLADRLLEKGLVCEFADPDFLVLMLTPETGEGGLQQLETALLSIGQKPAIPEKPPVFHSCEKVVSIREAMLSPRETIPVENSVGRVLAATSVGCPPAVPIVVSGERIDEAAVRCFAYYGIERCTVMQ
jgi:arginine/lysine/ornithine decarboxylase